VECLRGPAHLPHRFPEEVHPMFGFLVRAGMRWGLRRPTSGLGLLQPFHDGLPFALESFGLLVLLCPPQMADALVQLRKSSVQRIEGRVRRRGFTARGIQFLQAPAETSQLVLELPDQRLGSLPFDAVFELADFPLDGGDPFEDVVPLLFTSLCERVLPPFGDLTSLELLARALFGHFSFGLLGQLLGLAGQSFGLFGRPACIVDLALVFEHFGLVAKCFRVGPHSVGAAIGSPCNAGDQSGPCQGQNHTQQESFHVESLPNCINGI
jgi:hypothetical protein